MLKFELALHAFKNPFGQLPPRRLVAAKKLESTYARYRTNNAKRGQSRFRSIRPSRHYRPEGVDALVPEVNVLTRKMDREIIYAQHQRSSRKFASGILGIVAKRKMSEYSEHGWLKTKLKYEDLTGK